MIDVQHDDRAPVGVGPGLGQDEGGKRVPAAGHRHRDRLCQAGIEPAVESGGAQASHLARTRAVAARPFAASPAFG